MQLAVLLRRIRRRLRRAISLPRLAQSIRPGGDIQLAPTVQRLQSLPPVIEYTGEFGAELILFLPWCNWLSEAGLLRERSIRTYAGMRCFYDALDCMQIFEKVETRYYVPSRDRDLPVRDEHDFDGGGRSPFHLYPDLRRKFLALPTPLNGSTKPILIVHNKYNYEWDRTPVNYIPLDTLRAIFDRLQHRFCIVYIRHGMAGAKPGFSGDEMPPLLFDDRHLLTCYPDIACFDDVYEEHREAGGLLDLNSFKNALYARAFHFITAQGGGAHHIALFSGSLMIVLHRGGRETELAYGDGYYGFMANPAPMRVICPDPAALLDSLPLFGDGTVADGRALVPPGEAPLLARFSAHGGHVA